MNFAKIESRLLEVIVVEYHLQRNLKRQETAIFMNRGRNALLAVSEYEYEELEQLKKGKIKRRKLYGAEKISEGRLFMSKHSNND